MALHGRIACVRPERTSQRAAQDELSILDYNLIDRASAKPPALIKACAFNVGSPYRYVALYG